MKFLVPNYSCLHNPCIGGYRPQIPFLSGVCPQVNLLNHQPPPPPTLNKILGYATERNQDVISPTYTTNGYPTHGYLHSTKQQNAPFLN